MQGAGTYFVNDYIGSVSDLIAGTGGITAFNDLGSGLTFGARFYDESDDLQKRSIVLNSNAVASLNGAMSSGQEVWAIGGNFVPVIPEPNMAVLMLAGAIFIAWRTHAHSWRRNAKGKFVLREIDCS